MKINNEPLRPIHLDDLPRYTNWPKRLLSLESFSIKHKTAQEVLREFNQDKWGQLLKQVRNMPKPTLDEVECLLVDPNKLTPCYVEGRLYLASEQRLLEMHLDLFESVLKPYLDSASCLVELGAGYGSKLLALAQREGFCKLPLYAAEYTNSGQELISILASELSKTINVGYCDFREMTIDNLRIPENALIFTSYAAHYVPVLSPDFVSFISKLNPRAVVHFEPCYEHYSLDSFHGMMCRRYVELNDYTRNLASIFEVSEDQGRISLRMQKNILGSNPFLPISVIEWAPLKKD